MTEPALRLFYRDGCHLCETLASMLYRGWPQIFGQIEWCDVDSREDWRERYGQRIPVLDKNGFVISELVPELQVLQEHFGPPAIPL